MSLAQLRAEVFDQGPRRIRVTLAVVAASLGFACQQSIERSLRPPDAQSQERISIPADLESPPDPITLEFDLPSDFSAREPDGTYVISGFRIGYFLPDAPTPQKVLDIPRDAVKINGQTARLSVPSVSLPEGSNSVVVRLQSVSGLQTSVWSDPSPLVTLPAATTVAIEPKPSAPRQKRESVRAELERHPALKAALDQVLAPASQTDAMLSVFRRVDDLARAVVLSRRHKLPFADLCKDLQERRPQSLRNALRRLRPELDARRAIRDARVEARSLLTPSARTKP